MLASGRYAKTDARGFMQARTPDELKTIWRIYPYTRRAPPDGERWSLPQVDFGRYTIVAWFGGPGDSCFSDFRVKRVLENPDTLTVELTGAGPGPDCTCAGMPVGPWAVLQLPQTPKPIGYV